MGLGGGQALSSWHNTAEGLEVTQRGHAVTSLQWSRVQGKAQASKSNPWRPVPGSWECRPRKVSPASIQVPRNLG